MHPKTADRKGKNLQDDEKIGLQQMKLLFESLYYKVRVETTADGERLNWDPNTYIKDHQSKAAFQGDTTQGGNQADQVACDQDRDENKCKDTLLGKEIILIDHPADNYIDYNSLVDTLEEEHNRREVFTTALENTNQINLE